MAGEAPPVLGVHDPFLDVTVEGRYLGTVNPEDHLDNTIP